MSRQLIKLNAFKIYSRSFFRTASCGTLGHVLIGTVHTHKKYL